MHNNKSDTSSNESASDSIDQLVDADAANEVIADDESNLRETKLKDKRTKFYKTGTSENFSRLVIIKFWMILLVFVI